MESWAYKGCFWDILIGLGLIVWWVLTPFRLLYAILKQGYKEFRSCFKGVKSCKDCCWPITCFTSCFAGVFKCCCPNLMKNKDPRFWFMVFLLIPVYMFILFMQMFAIFAFLFSIGIYIFIFVAAWAFITIPCYAIQVWFIFVWISAACFFSSI